MNGYDFGNIENGGDFKGAYIAEMKRVIIAALVSDTHVMFLGEPGFGKTELPRVFLERIFDGKMKFFRIDPATDPDQIKGLPDLKIYEETSQYVRQTGNTLFDPFFDVILIDEITRGNPATSGTLMNVLDRNSTGIKAAIVSTANWLPEDEFSQALIDRLGMIMSVKGGIFDDIVYSDLVGGRKRDPNPGEGIPTEEYIEFCRTAIPSPETARLVDNYVKHLASQAAIGIVDNDGKSVANFNPNIRRIKTWGRIVYATCVYWYGSADFTEIHQEAERVLTHAWIPTQRRETSKAEREMGDWKAFAGIQIKDPIELFVSNMLDECIEQINNLAGNTTKNKIAIAGDLARFATHKSEELADILMDSGVQDPHSDKRWIEALAQINNYVERSLRGEKLA